MFNIRYNISEWKLKTTRFAGQRVIAARHCTVKLQFHVSAHVASDVTWSLYGSSIFVFIWSRHNFSNHPRESKPLLHWKNPFLLYIKLIKLFDSPDCCRTPLKLSLSHPSASTASHQSTQKPTEKSTKNSPLQVFVQQHHCQDDDTGFINKLLHAHFRYH